jgi:anti-sigma B factor antagonist
MQFEVATLETGVVRVTIGGRLDMDAAIKLENPFTFRVATTKAPVVVDLSAVDFIASIAMRLLLKNARAQQGRGGKLVLYKPTALVREALTTAGIATIIPMHDDFEVACQDALAGTTA